MAPPRRALPLRKPLPHTAANHPQVGIGPDALPERKKPNLSAELIACTTRNFLWLPDLGSNQGPTD